MRGLDDLLMQEEPQARTLLQPEEIKGLHITKYAFEKARTYARLALEKARSQVECGGYLIQPKEAQDRVATDAFLARNQDVSAGLFTINAQDVIVAGREIDEMGYKVLGWWHSHGRLPTFFSTTDDSGQMTMLNEIAAFNYHTLHDSRKLGNLQVRQEGGSIILFDKKNPGTQYVLDGLQIAGRDISLSIAQERRIGFAYGLVVNVPPKRIGKYDRYGYLRTNNQSQTFSEDGELLFAQDDRGKPYAEVATRHFCASCRQAKDRSSVEDIVVFDRAAFELDEDALRAEIAERVRIRPAYIVPPPRRMPFSESEGSFFSRFRSDSRYGLPKRDEEDWYD